MVKLNDMLVGPDAQAGKDGVLAALNVTQLELATKYPCLAPDTALNPAQRAARAFVNRLEALIAITL